VLVALGGVRQHRLALAWLVSALRAPRTGVTLSLREQMYVEAGRGLLGPGDTRLWRRYILPSISGTILGDGDGVDRDGHSAEAGFSFLGLGVQPPGSSLGNMIGQGLINMLDAPWVILGPTLATACYAVCPSTWWETACAISSTRRTRNT